MGKILEKFMDDLFTLLVNLPIWVGPMLCIFVYVVFDASLNISELVAPRTGYLKIYDYFPLLASSIVFIAWIKVMFFNTINSKRIDAIKDRESLLALHWSEFEQMVGFILRKEGYFVLENLEAGPDGGVDLLAKKDDKLLIIQCKKWKDRSVGVSIVREMFGILHDRKANEVMIISTGFFTEPAKEFARGKPIRLLDGDSLLQYFQEYQKSGHEAKLTDKSVDVSTKPVADSPICPMCGASMVIRTAKKGSNQGQQFYGCSTYPKCRGTRTIPEVHPKDAR